MVIELELSKIMTAYSLLDGDGNTSIKKLGLNFKGKAALKISLLKLKLKDLCITAEEIRISLVKKYGTLDVETENYLVSNENVPLMVTEYNEVLNTKHEITFTPLTFDDFDDINVPLEITDGLIYFFEV